MGIAHDSWAWAWLMVNGEYEWFMADRGLRGEREEGRKGKTTICLWWGGLPRKTLYGFLSGDWEGLTNGR